MIQSTQQGRRLVLTVETGEGEERIEPFFVLPLSVNIGRLLTGHFIGQTTQASILSNEQLETLFMVALDGGVYTPESADQPEMIDVRRNEDGSKDTPNYTRALDELSQSESEDLFWKAFLWQSVLGQEGLAMFDDAGGGTPGILKTMRLLMLRKGIPVPQFEDGTQQAGPLTKPSNDASSVAPPTAQHRLPKRTVDRLPPEKRSKKKSHSPA